MMSYTIYKNEDIERAVVKVCDSIDTERNQLTNWNKYSEAQLWVELVSCILGSRVRYETAKGCTKHLHEHGLIEIPNILNNSHENEFRIAKELSKAIFPPITKGKGSRYRYPKSKAKYIVTTCIEIYHNSPTTIKKILNNSTNEEQAREILVKKCQGIGVKQASLFLRNISYGQNLAIIDSHVMDYMILMNLNRHDIKRDSMTKKQYLTNEKILVSYAESLNRHLSSLDIAIWIVMRVLKKEAVS